MNNYYNSNDCIESDNNYNNYNNNYDNNPAFQKSMLIELMKLQHAIQDCALFLDTHPNDPVAMIKHHEYSTRLKQVKSEYTTKYGPLDVYTPDITNYWRYLNNPWPWE